MVLWRRQGKDLVVAWQVFLESPGNEAIQEVFLEDFVAFVDECLDTAHVSRLQHIFKVEWNTSVISSMTEETGAWSGLVGFFDATKYGAREGNSSIVKAFSTDRRK